MEERKESAKLDEMQEKNSDNQNGAGNASEYSVVFEHAGIRYPQAAEEAISGIDLKVKRDRLSESSEEPVPVNLLWSI